MLRLVVTRLLRLAAWLVLAAAVAFAAIALGLGRVGVLLALWFCGTVGVLFLLRWRARRRDEPARLGLLWDERPD